MVEGIDWVLGTDKTKASADSFYKEHDMEKLFNPSSVVIFGVSTHPANLGKEIARNLFEFRYTGVIHLVGKEGGVLFGRKIHDSLDEIKDDIDLAIILTPAKTVPDLLDQCGKKGIKRAVIETGGFGEFGAEGKVHGERLKNIAQQYGMRFIGPNCIGIMNASNGLTTPFTRLQNVLRRGGVGIIAQSGGVALTFLNMFDSEQLGFSKFASIGNKINIDENDLLEFYVDDPETSIVCMYLESINDGKRLVRIASTSRKPILAHKANISSLSKTVAESHTDALVNDDQVVDAAFHQCGIVRFRDNRSYMDFVKILQLPRMQGRNLAIVSRSGGHAVMASDAAYTHNFNLPPFNEEFLDMIHRHLRAKVIRLSNPLDLGDLFDFEVYVRIIEHTLKQPEIDGILLIQTYFASVEGPSSRIFLNAVADLCKKYCKPVVLCVYTEQHEISRLFQEFNFPVFLDIERAVSALSASIKYHERVDSRFSVKEDFVPHPRPDAEKIKLIIGARSDERVNPLLDDSLEIMRSLGVKVPNFRMARNVNSLHDASSGLIQPLALKVVASEISHKSDQGGVILNQSGSEMIKQTFSAMQEKFGTDPGLGFKGILLQEMAPPEPGAVELIVGAKRDPQFGTVVMLGHGGIFTEIFGKTSVRVAPFSSFEINEMIESLPGSEILSGARNRPAVDKKALVEVIGRVGWLMEVFQEIDQIDLNPVQVSSSGALALDARIYLKPLGKA